MFDLYARVAGDMAAHDFKKFVSVSGRFIATAERRPRATKSGRESDPIMMTLPPREFRWSPGTAACCGANPTLLEVLIEDEWLSDVRCTLSWVSSGEELDGMPLCAAAAVGRLEQVKLLLDAGEAVNDTAERRSNYTPADAPDGWANMEDYIVTPLYMALQKGHAVPLVHNGGFVPFLERKGTEQAVDVLLHQLHIAGKTGLALAQDNLEFFCLSRFNHAVKVGPQAAPPQEVSSYFI